MRERIIWSNRSPLDCQALRLGVKLFRESKEPRNPTVGFGTIVFPDFDTPERYAYVVVDIHGKTGIVTSEIISLKPKHEIIAMNAGGHKMIEYVDKVSNHPPIDAETIMRGYDNYLRITTKNPNAAISDELRRDILERAERIIPIPRY